MIGRNKPKRNEFQRIHRPFTDQDKDEIILHLSTPTPTPTHRMADTSISNHSSIVVRIVAILKAVKDDGVDVSVGESKRYIYGYPTRVARNGAASMIQEHRKFRRSTRSILGHLVLSQMARNRFEWQLAESESCGTQSKLAASVQHCVTCHIRSCHMTSSRCTCVQNNTNIRYVTRRSRSFIQ